MRGRDGGRRLVPGADACGDRLSANADRAVRLAARGAVGRVCGRRLARLLHGARCVDRPRAALRLRPVPALRGAQAAPPPQARRRGGNGGRSGRVSGGADHAPRLWLAQQLSAAAGAGRGGGAVPERGRQGCAQGDAGGGRARRRHHRRRGRRDQLARGLSSRTWPAPVLELSPSRRRCVWLAGGRCGGRVHDAARRGQDAPDARVRKDVAERGAADARRGCALLGDAAACGVDDHRRLHLLWRVRALPTAAAGSGAALALAAAHRGGESGRGREVGAAETGGSEGRGGEG
mmetsp:Transcript_19497/g.62084  ORF Transcript_19497/g.62084 Transcript_19497/m.62084 type:complete len:291 (+) Transcript_19497:365-1237(+)